MHLYSFDWIYHPTVICKLLLLFCSRNSLHVTSDKELSRSLLSIYMVSVVCYYLYCVRNSTCIICEDLDIPSTRAGKLVRHVSYAEPLIFQVLVLANEYEFSLIGSGRIWGKQDVCGKYCEHSITTFLSYWLSSFSCNTFIALLDSSSTGSSISCYTL